MKVLLKLKLKWDLHQLIDGLKHEVWFDLWTETFLLRASSKAHICCFSLLHCNGCCSIQVSCVSWALYSFFILFMMLNPLSKSPVSGSTVKRSLQRFANDWKYFLFCQLAPKFDHILFHLIRHEQIPHIVIQSVELVSPQHFQLVKMAIVKPLHYHRDELVAFNRSPLRLRELAVFQYKLRPGKRFRKVLPIATM